MTKTNVFGISAVVGLVMVLALAFAMPAQAATITIINNNSGTIVSKTTAVSSTGGNKVGTGGTIVTGNAKAVATSTNICSRNCNITSVVTVIERTGNRR